MYNPAPWETSTLDLRNQLEVGDEKNLDAYWKSFEQDLLDEHIRSLADLKDKNGLVYFLMSYESFEPAGFIYPESDADNYDALQKYLLTLDMQKLLDYARDILLKSAKSLLPVKSEKREVNSGILTGHVMTFRIPDEDLEFIMENYVV